MPLFSTFGAGSNRRFGIQRTISSGPVIPGPFSSAVAAMAAGQTQNGVYNINLPTVGVKPIYCILDTNVNGGGWMLAMKGKKFGTSFYWDSSHWTSNSTLNPTDVTRLVTNNQDAKYDTFNYYSASNMLALFPSENTGGGTLGNLGPTYGHNWKSSVPSGPTTLLNMFNNGNDQDLSYTGGGELKNSAETGGGNPFGSQGGYQYYGINAINGQSGIQVRWGFDWNNEGSPGSNDAGGGIGLTSSVGDYQNGAVYQCGDWWGYSGAGDAGGGHRGVGRSISFEIYVK